ncbi:hypothetical protein FRC0206_02225 [Corynebacterium diphtheriae]|nr:hypothetical protein FRC0205_02075 [Corynebacterium diphtheriae]CAB0819068.1 hypothetical protein FRC0206_02225 [Corynebacterium diphtheriae]
MVGYLSSQPDWAGYQVSTKKGSGPSSFRGDVGVRVSDCLCAGGLGLQVVRESVGVSHG